MSLQDKRSVFQVIGCLMKKPSLLNEERYKLIKEDFDEQFHKIIFASIVNLYNQGIEDIDEVMIDSFLSNYDVQYKIFNDNNGLDYIQSAVENSSLNNFEYNYNRVKKFSILRAYKENGIDISEVYDDVILNPKEQEDMQDRFDKYTIQDIVDIIDKKIMQIKEDFLVEYGAIGQQAGKGMKKLKEDLKKSPAMGMPLNSKILTTLARGARLKKLYMRSAPTGVGKCVKGDTLIYTDKGLIEIQDIPKYYNLDKDNKLVAKVISYDLETGKKNELETSHWYNMGHSETIRVKTLMGYEIEGTPEHPIVVGDENGDIFFKKLKDVTNKDKVIISLDNSMFGEEKVDNDLSYLLGFLTGDGYLNVENGINKRNHLSYSKSNQDIYEKVNQMLKNKIVGVNKIVNRKKHDSQTVDHDFGNIETIEFLQNECGLSMEKSENKKVPQKIMSGEKLVVIKFLQGLFDTDGSITCGMFEYSTASLKLAEQVHMLLLNFGILSNRRIKVVNNKDYHIISIHNHPMLKKFYDEIGFNLAKEKQNKLEKLIEEEKLNSNCDYAYGKVRLQLLHNHLKENYKNEYKYNRKKSLNYQFNKTTFYESMMNGRRNSRERIKKIMNGLTGLPNELTYLQNTINNMFFDSVSSITNSESVVYDFTVPVTHNFVANGTISHNTRLSLGDAGTLAINEIYDSEKKMWISNGTAEPTLFITTELEMDEVQTPLIAFVSDVAEEKILDGNYTKEEEIRIDKAIEIIDNSPLWIEHLPNFNVNDVERTIHKYVLNEKVKFVFFDYVHTSMKLLEEIAQQSKGMKLREDNVLLMFVDRLKALCNRLGVFIFTATQVSGDWKNTKDADQSLLRGSKAMADKLDLGIIAREPTSSDMDAIKPILQNGFMKEPNIVFDIYKNRRNKLVRVKLWAYADLGTCRTYDLFLTDQKYNPIQVESTKIESYLDEEVEAEREEKTIKKFDF